LSPVFITDALFNIALDVLTLQICAICIYYSKHSHDTNVIKHGRIIPAYISFIILCYYTMQRERERERKRERERERERESTQA
jgi:hypothetical protein